MVGTPSFSQPYLRIHPMLQSAPNIRSSTSVDCCLPISPLLVHKIILTINTTLFFYKHTGKLGGSSMCLRFFQFEPELMLDGMLNFKTHFMV